MEQPDIRDVDTRVHPAVPLVIGVAILALTMFGDSRNDGHTAWILGGPIGGGLFLIGAVRWVLFWDD